MSWTEEIDFETRRFWPLSGIRKKRAKAAPNLPQGQPVGRRRQSITCLAGGPLGTTLTINERTHSLRSGPKLR
jgi:hypothetical protein